jgi:SAM-dependent methyltransferase
VKRGLRERFHQYLETATLRSLHGYPPQPVDALTSCLGRLGNWYFNVARRRSQWIDYRGQGRLLDFGCGAGVFLERMRNRGWTVEGVEVSGAVAEDVRRRTGIQVHAGSLPHANLHDGQFDVVTMWQSLEHVHNPREVIAAARQLVAPQGQLLVAVPNLACWSFQTFGEHWFALDVPRHLNHFTPLTLTKLIESEGFVVRRMQHVGLDGWIRHSARTALDHGASPRLAKACLWKPIAVQAARRSQRREQGDVILAWADPV